MANLIYNSWKGKDGKDWASGTVKGMLVTSAYTPDADHAHPNATGLASNELTGGTYARQSITNRAVTPDLANDRVDHTADNPTFLGLAASSAPKYLVLYWQLTNDTDHVLIACLDLGTLLLSGDYSPKFNAGATNGVVFRGL